MLKIEIEYFIYLVQRCVHQIKIYHHAVRYLFNIVWKLFVVQLHSKKNKIQIIEKGDENLYSVLVIRLYS